MVFLFNLLRKKSLFPLALLAVLLFVGTTFCANASNEALYSTPPFADPNETTEMGKEWEKRKLKHPDDVDADLYAVLSYQMSDVWKEWIDDFARQRNIAIHTQDGVDGTSAGALRRKEADVACYCGSPKRSDRMPGVEFHTAGVVPVAIYTNAKNPVNNLSLETVMKIFRGEINNWAEVGGDVMNVIPVARSHCKKRRGRWRPLDDMDNLSPSAIKVGSIEDALTYVASTTGSIGYELLSKVEPLVRSGQVKVLSVNQMNPFELENLSRGVYPLYRVYTFTTWRGEGVENPLAGDMVDMLIEKTAANASDIFFVPASELRKSGWSFLGNELIGEPVNPDSY